MTLRPTETVQKALLSTTSHFVGEYDKEDALLALAWPDFADSTGFIRWQAGPASRSALLFACKTDPVEHKAGSALPDYSLMGDWVCSYLAVLFGKRFDSHGLTEGTGLFHVPELGHFGRLCNNSLPHNSHAERADFPIPLNLTEFSRIDRLALGSDFSIEFRRAFEGAAKFYLQALRNAEDQPEVAYLHLITAGEILSNFHEFDKLDLFDEQTKKVLAEIESGLTNGKKAASFISGRLLQIKRRFVKTLTQLVDESFFSRTETAPQYAEFGRLVQDRFADAISAAYDLRSRYVHTGVPFRTWVAPGPIEVQLGAPVVGDKDFERILGRAPTFVGLERVIRYSLLRFAEAHGAYVAPKPNVAPASDATTAQ